jgi:hypothetical protein
MGGRAVTLSDVGDATPLRLDVAARLAFPDGSITGKSLRREAERGRLEIERIAGKDFTTLAAIQRMRDQCRVLPNRPASISASDMGASPSLSSSTGDARSALVAARSALSKLKSCSRPTSPKSTSPSGAMVIQLESRLPT